MKKLIAIVMLLLLGLTIGNWDPSTRISPSKINTFQFSSPDEILSPYNVQAARKRKNNPIYIDGDDDFRQQAKRNGWKGDGSESNPYLIENYDITIPVKKGRGKKRVPDAVICISNITTVHFKIQYNTFTNYNGEIDGVALWKVETKSSILNNYIYSFYRGISIWHSDYITIDNNDIHDTGTLTSISSQNMQLKIAGTTGGFGLSHGIFLDPSDHNIITNNRISGYSGSGVYLLESSYNDLIGNIIDNNEGGEGIFLNDSSYNTVTENNIYTSTESTSLAGLQGNRLKIEGGFGLSHGIFLDPSVGNNISNNHISGFDGSGVYLLESSDNDLFGNIIDNSLGESGIFLNDSSYNTIFENTIFESTESTSLAGLQGNRLKIEGGFGLSHGIFLDPSVGNNISNNHISGFDGSGVYLLESSDNDLFGNIIDNSLGESGIFLNDSSYNTIFENTIFESTESTSLAGLQGSRLKIEGGFGLSHGIFLDPSVGNNISNNHISGFDGSGVYLLESSDN
ncbi:MAG: NosD domain-containing protein, partial [Candidatus Hodarchaeales archaeon]